MNSHDTLDFTGHLRRLCKLHGVELIRGVGRWPSHDVPGRRLRTPVPLRPLTFFKALHSLGRVVMSGSAVGESAQFFRAFLWADAAFLESTGVRRNREAVRWVIRTFSRLQQAEVWAERPVG